LAQACGERRAMMLLALLALAAGGRPGTRAFVPPGPLPRFPAAGRAAGPAVARLVPAAVSEPTRIVAQLVPVAIAAPRARPVVALGGDSMPIGELFKKYGAVGLLFHFTVWVSSLALVYALLAGNVDLTGLIERLPGGLAEKLGGAASESAGRAGATLAFVEATGPLRLGLTVAATPRIAKALRLDGDGETVPVSDALQKGVVRSTSAARTSADAQSGRDR